MSGATVAAEAVGGATGDGFSVSYETSSAREGCVLNVRRVRWVEPALAARLQRRGAALSMVSPRADGLVAVLCPVADDGRVFATSAEAQRHALERGYTRRYFTSPELRARRVERAERPLVPCLCGELAPRGQACGCCPAS